MNRHQCDGCHIEGNVLPNHRITLKWMHRFTIMVSLYSIEGSIWLCKTNGTRSCGCLRRTPSPTRINLTGQVFGKLTVLKETGERKSGNIVWLCQCECGKQVSVSSDALRSGHTKSCSCIARQMKYDLTGAKFGNLLVLGPVKNRWIKGNETRWKCKCRNCGRTVEVPSYWLRHSNPNGHCKCTRFKG